MHWCFIFSLPRSGSTLLTVLIDKSNQCLVLPETHFFVFCSEIKNISFSSNKKKVIKSWVSFYRTRKWIQDREALENRLMHKASDYKQLFTETVLHFMNENNIESHKNLLVIEKSPPHMYFQNQISSVFEECKAIYLIRDPRSIIASLLNISWSTHNIFTLSRVWNRFVGEVGLIKNSIIVKYENLVQENDIELNRIYSFLGLDYTNNPKNNNEYKLKDKIDFNNPIHKEILKPVNNNNIDKWKSILSYEDMEVAQIEKMCHKGMIKYEYYNTIKERPVLKTNLFILLNAMRLLTSKIFKK